MYKKITDVITKPIINKTMRFLAKLEMGVYFGSILFLIIDINLVYLQ